jgi:hypothetical protein
MRSKISSPAIQGPSWKAVRVRHTPLQSLTEAVWTWRSVAAAMVRPGKSARTRASSRDVQVPEIRARPVEGVAEGRGIVLLVADDNIGVLDQLPVNVSRGHLSLRPQRRPEVEVVGHDGPMAPALQFSLSHPGISRILIGARSAREVTQDIGWLDHPIPDKLWPELLSRRVPARRGYGG